MDAKTREFLYSEIIVKGTDLWDMSDDEFDTYVDKRSEEVLINIAERCASEEEIQDIHLKWVGDIVMGMVLMARSL